MNRGAKALKHQTPERGDLDRLAKKVGVDQGYLSNVRQAKRVPGLDVRRKLREHCSIPLEWWDEVIDETAVGTLSDSDGGEAA